MTTNNNDTFGLLEEFDEFDENTYEFRDTTNNKTKEVKEQAEQTQQESTDIGLVEEFSDFEDESDKGTIESSQQILSISNEYIKETLKLFNKDTLSGVKIEELMKLISFNETDLIPWSHVTFDLVSYRLRDVKGKILKEFSIPSTVEELRNSELTADGWSPIPSSLEKIDIPKSVSIIDSGVFINSPKLKNVIFEEGSKLQAIGNLAFAFCQKLAYLNLENCTELQFIGASAFSNSNINTLILPKSLSEINPKAFDGATIQKIVINEHEYKFKDFIEELEANNYTEFWKDIDIYNF